MSFEDELKRLRTSSPPGPTWEQKREELDHWKRMINQHILQPLLLIEDKYIQAKSQMFMHLRYPNQPISLDHRSDEICLAWNPVEESVSSEVLNFSLDQGSFSLDRALRIRYGSWRDSISVHFDSISQVHVRGGRAPLSQAKELYAPWDAAFDRQYEQELLVLLKTAGTKDYGDFHEHDGWVMLDGLIKLSTTT